MRARALLLLYVLSVVLPAEGAAQEAERLRVEALRPNGGPLDVGRVAQSRPVASGSVVGSLFFHHRVDPRVLEAPWAEGVEASREGGALRVEMLAAAGLWEWAEVALAVPLVVGRSGGNPHIIGTEGYALAGVLGDMRLQGKLAVPGLRRRAGESGLGAALTLGAGLPTRSGWELSQAGLVVDWRFDSGALLSLNASAGLRPSQGALVGLATEMPLTEDRRWALLSLFHLATPLEGIWQTGLSAETLAGLRWYGPQSLTYTLGAGLGSEGRQGLTYRVFASVAWVLPGMAERQALEQTLSGRVQPPAPLARPEVPLYAPVVDADNDYLLPPVDECPEVAGPVANKGCPDRDEDGDGVVDRLDKCPAHAESAPGLEGCPLARLEGGRLVLSDPIAFVDAQAYLLEESLPVVGEVGWVLKENPQVQVEVVAYSPDTSSKGLEVARQRAEQVLKRVLVEGVALERLCVAVRVDAEVRGGPRPQIELVVLEGQRRCLQELSEEPLPLGWPEVDSEQEVLKPFLAAPTPAQYIELQHRVDMRRVVERLSPWGAVRLGAQGPLVAEVAELNRKRVEFIVYTVQKFGLDVAEVFALYVVHHAYTEELREVLRLLAAQKRLGETVGRMTAVREALAERGINLEEYPDRPEQVRDVGRGLVGLAEAASDSTELSRGVRGATYYAWKGQLPPAYGQALTEVEKEQWREYYQTSTFALGTFDYMTFGVPVGLYHLVEGTGRGLASLHAGKWERATQELAPAMLLVALYARSHAPRGLAWARGEVLWRLREGGKLPRLSVERLQAELGEVAQRLFNKLGGEGMVEVARYMRESREAALLVYETGEAGAVALYNAEGNAGRARAWLMEGNKGGKGAGRSAGGMRKPKGGLASLVDESVGHTREVVEAKLLAAELESTGARLSGDLAVLEKARPSLDAPPPGAQGHPLWGEYVAYWENRLLELKQGKATKPPLKWEGYEPMRGFFARGLAFERTMVQLLQADALLPPAQRLFLRDFHQPWIQVHAGVAKPDQPGIRYADVLVVEQAPPTGQLPRVETFSFKSRDLRFMHIKALTAQMRADAKSAFDYYGGMVDIRTPELGLRDILVPVQRVRLIYEGKLKPEKSKILDSAKREVKRAVEEVEVDFQ